MKEYNKDAETRLVEQINKLKETGDKHQFLAQFKVLANSIYMELKSQNKTDEEITKEFGDICSRAGRRVGERENEFTKDVIASALLEFFVVYKHRK